MSKNFPLARAKRSKSISDVLILHEKEELIVQPKIEGISCYVTIKGDSVSIINRIGFNLTDMLKDKKFYDALSRSSIDDFHGLCVVRDDTMIFYDCLRVSSERLVDNCIIKRLDKLKNIDFLSCDDILLIDSFPVSRIDELINLGKKEIVLKTKKSKYPVQSARGKELLASWYSVRLLNSDTRDVIVDSFYPASTEKGKRDFIFRCKQYSKNRLIQVGKIRIQDPTERKHIISKLKAGKRIVCNIEVEKYDSLGRFKKMRFLYRKKDKPFSSVVVDSERIISPVEIINVTTKTKTSFEG